MRWFLFLVPLLCTHWGIGYAEDNSASITTLVQPMWEKLKTITKTIGDLTSLPIDRISSLDELRVEVDKVKNTTECEIRLLAYQYALTRIPHRAPMLDVFDGLELLTKCQVKRPEPVPHPPPAYDLPKTGFYVDPVAGHDSGTGSKNDPFKTVEKAVAATRLKGSHQAVILRKGVHYLSDGVRLDTVDNNLLITNYPKEEAWLSGGIPLSTKWTPYNTAAGANIYVTDVDPSISDITGLMTLQTHRRLTRARYPNALPEDRHTVKNLGGRDGLLGYIPPPIKPLAIQTWVNLTTGPHIYDHSILWQYNGYANGHCATAGDPKCPCGTWKDHHHGKWESASYHCSSKCAGGWENMDQGNGYYNGPILPLGLKFKNSSRIGDRVVNWKQPEGGIIVAWRAQGWFVNMYNISSVDQKNGVIHWVDKDGMPQGGWQGGRGWQLNGTTGAIEPNPPFYIENIFEELDAPDEWFFDKAKHKLYLWYNGTGAPPSSETFVATQLKEMIGIRGTQTTPVKGVTIQGIGFRDAAITFMEPWGVPSGGDWALYRGGAVYIEGAEGITIRGNTFKRVDGNALFVSGYTRQVIIDDNEFAWIGDCAMAGWGYTEENDGTGGEQPRGTQISRNYAHEVGTFQLQSSMWFQAKAAQTNLTGNLFFNGPRSGINFNDGFGGGNNVESNLIFNQCRHSGDHGPINSWDRQPYLTDIRYGVKKPSYEPADTEVVRNFIIANYGGSQGFDNDDGSSYYDIHENFIYGEGLKQDYGGHDSRYTNNVNVVHHYDGQNCINTWPFLRDFVDNFTQNTCVVLYTWQYGSTGQCNANDPKKGRCDNVPHGQKCMAHLADNRYYTPFGNASLKCGGSQVPISKLQQGGIELRTTDKSLPSNDQIIAWGKEILQM